MIKFRHDIPEGGAFPDQWMGWGIIKPYYKDKYSFERYYFFIKLPNWRWMQTCYDDNWMWHQAFLRKVGSIGVPDSKYDGWALGWWPCWDAQND